MAGAHLLGGAWRLVRASGPPPITPFMVNLVTNPVVYSAGKARRLLGWDGGREPLAALRAATVAHAAADHGR